MTPDAAYSSTRSRTLWTGCGPYLPRRSFRNASHSSTSGTRMPTRAGAHTREANAAGLSWSRSCASRLVRLETGSSSEAVFASQTVVSANGSGGMRA